MDLRDSPCIFSGSNGHVPPLIEGGRGVELPGEIRGNELKVTRVREMVASLSLSLFLRIPLSPLLWAPPLRTNRTCHHYTVDITTKRQTTGSLTTTRDTSITEINTLSSLRFG